MEFLLLHPELDGEGIGRRVQDGEHMHTHGGFVNVWQNQQNVVT